MAHLLAHLGALLPRRTLAPSYLLFRLALIALATIAAAFITFFAFLRDFKLAETCFVFSLEFREKIVARVLQSPSCLLRIVTHGFAQCWLFEEPIGLIH